MRKPLFGIWLKSARLLDRVDAVQHFSCYGDHRNKGKCVHCGGAAETDDHVPSKVLLDEPYPTNLMVCPACFNCNNSLSPDEEYLACLLECVIAGDTAATNIRRPKIARSLERNDGLRRMLGGAMSDVEGRRIWSVDNERVTTVLLKLARGHAAYEQNLPQLDPPSKFYFRPLETMTTGDRDAFEGSDGAGIAAWPEVGTRAIQRLLVVGSDVHKEDWLVVQPHNYRFRVDTDDGVRVRIVLREYLACDIAWD